MAKYVVMAVANERVKRVWKDNQTKKDVEHTGLTVFVGNASTNYAGALPLEYRKVPRADGTSFNEYRGKITIWDDKQKDLVLVPGDTIECEWSSDGKLKYVGLAE